MITAFKNKIKEQYLYLYLRLVKPSLREKATLAKHLSVMLKSGLSITEALAAAQDQASFGLRLVLAEITQAVKAGSSLAEAFGRWPQVFSSLFISIIAAGEASGRLDENLEIMANHLKKQKELKTKIKGALFYPTLVLVLALVVGLGVAWLIFPKIIPLFKGLDIELPLATRLLIRSADFFAHYGGRIFLTLIILIVFLFSVRRQRFFKRINHWILLHLPFLGSVAKKSNLAMISQTLSALLSSGLTVKESLLSTKEIISNYYYKKNLNQAAKNIEFGSDLTQALSQEKWLYPQLVLNMISVGEKSGRLEETLDYLAGLYEEEVSESVKFISRAIEPVFLLGLGLLVGTLALAVITPMYKLTENVYR